MNGGSISDNTAREFGGGVFLRWDAISFTMHGGIIAGNTAGDGGGGVAVVNTGGETVLSGGVFKKLPALGSQTSGIIYGNDGSVNRNKATQGESSFLNNKGHAVYIQASSKTRETTAGQGDHLDSTVAGTNGGWI
jgi:hypothetical protein